MWFTGLSGAGKSTVAELVAARLRERGREVTVLDGDVVRMHLSKGLGFSKEDRDINIRRIGFVASEVVHHHGIALCAAVSPYRRTREECRLMVGPDRFVEVFVDTPIAVCEQRDVKGLYAKARRGELKGFTGIDDPYEAPLSPDLRLDTTQETAETSAHHVMAELIRRRFVNAATELNRDPERTTGDVGFGTGVSLRALDHADVPRWAQWFNDPAITRRMNKGAFPNTEAQQADVLERLQRSRNDVQFGVVSADNSELAGIIGLHHIDWIHRHADMSIVIGETARHRGMGTEAIALMTAHGFEKLNLHKITAGMWINNQASRRAFEKNGFRLEGTLRESFWCEGRWVDEIRLGLLRSEWKGPAAGLDTR